MRPLPLTGSLTPLIVVALLQGAVPLEAAAPDELDALRERVTALEKDLGQSLAGRAGTAGALQEAERLEAQLRSELRGSRAQLGRARERERQLREELERRQQQFEREQAALAGELRLAYVAGREEWLRLVLSGQEPAALSRRVTHYGYLTRHRRAMLGNLQREAAALRAAATELAAELGKLTALESRQSQQLGQLTSVRKARAAALRELEKSLASRREKLARLRREARALEDVLAPLQREAGVSPPGSEPELPGRTAARGASVRSLPLRGRVTARYGQPRADGLLRWDGLLIAAPAGSDVRAVRAGRVVYADWLQGLGFLAVVDHGGGLMTLYGHNQDLVCRVGEKIGEGDLLGHVGDSGGAGNPGLYFEVRRNGRPVDPQRWIR